MRPLTAKPNNAIVLIVEDMKSMRIMVQEALKSIGFKQFILCEHGKEALKKLECSEVHLIISDWDMPYMNGLDLLREIRRNERLSELPFIMLTANASAPLVRQSIEVGSDDYIIKPFRPSVLHHKIARLYRLTEKMHEEQQKEDSLLAEGRANLARQ